MGLRVVHNTLQGRLRVRAEELRGNEKTLRETAQELGGLSGIINVETNPITGSILVNFDVALINEKDILFHLSDKSGLSLDPEEVKPQPSGSSVSKGLEIQHLARVVEEPFRDLNAGLLRVTNGYMDFRYLLPVALMAYGTSKLVRLGPVPAIPWYLSYWWSFRTFVLLNRQMKPS
ncbi:MAG: hypothetical protein IT393_04870 [Nitrospirae bacterium]|nr:hypothetical protein [Nitrospirota bacterium]